MKLFKLLLLIAVVAFVPAQAFALGESDPAAKAVHCPTEVAGMDRTPAVARGVAQEPDTVSRPYGTRGR